MANTLRLSELDHRTLHELQSARFGPWKNTNETGDSTDAELNGLFAMLQGRWSETTAADRQRFGSTLAMTGKSPTALLAPVYECLEQAARLPDAGPHLLLLVKAILVDLQVVLDGYAATSQANLRQALELALNAKIDLQQFARLASHDLKTPLATVANLCDEALDEFGEEIPIPARKLIGAARNRIFESSRTIDGLLEAATQHHTANMTRHLSLESVLADATQRLRIRFPQRAMTVESTGSLPNVYGDPLRLREALLQIFANAVVSNNQPVAEIKVAAEVCESGCLLRISSDSLGFEPDQAENLFCAYFQSNRGTDGSGLALYLRECWLSSKVEPVGRSTERRQRTTTALASDKGYVNSRRPLAGYSSPELPASIWYFSSNR